MAVISSGLGNGVAVGSGVDVYAGVAVSAGSGVVVAEGIRVGVVDEAELGPHADNRNAAIMIHEL
jgi:hypothetical protein